jgi:hypothetical protein
LGDTPGKKENVMKKSTLKVKTAIKSGGIDVGNHTRNLLK